MWTASRSSTTTGKFCAELPVPDPFSADAQSLHAWFAGTVERDTRLRGALHWMQSRYVHAPIGHGRTTPNSLKQQHFTFSYSSSKKRWGTPLPFRHLDRIRQSCDCAEASLDAFMKFLI